MVFDGVVAATVGEHSTRLGLPDSEADGEEAEDFFQNCIREGEFIENLRRAVQCGDGAFEGGAEVFIVFGANTGEDGGIYGEEVVHVLNWAYKWSDWEWMLIITY